MASASDGRILTGGEAKLQEMEEWRVKGLQNNSAHKRCFQKGGKREVEVALNTGDRFTALLSLSSPYSHCC